MVEIFEGKGGGEVARAPRLAPDEHKGGIWRLDGGRGGVGVTIEYGSRDAWLSEFCCAGFGDGGVGERGVLGEEERVGDREVVSGEDAGGGCWGEDDDWVLVD